MAALSYAARCSFARPRTSNAAAPNPTDTAVAGPGTPTGTSYTGHGEIIPLEFVDDTPIIDACVLANGLSAACGKFEIDTGCDDAICLGADFVATHTILKSAEAGKKSVRQSVGGGIETRETKLDQLKIGQLTVEKPSCNCFLRGSPASDGQAATSAWARCSASSSPSTIRGSG